ncbi:MAG: hypothetical protein U1G08_09920 [Verrucomicrobiota bacterium]
MVNATAGQKLQELRNALLTLHKTLLESERVGYEEAIGPIPSPNHFLHLVTTDPWFAWLRPLSRLIVTLDETLDAPDAPSTAVVDDLVLQVRRLLVASEEGDGFPRSYFEALQRDPDVVFAHAGVTAVFRPTLRSS